jgi:hypothetical protein
VTKFSGLAVFPVLVLLSLGVAWGPWDMALDLRGSALRGRLCVGRAERLAAMVLVAVYMSLVALGVIWTSYGLTRRL